MKNKDAYEILAGILYYSGEKINQLKYSEEGIADFIIANKDKYEVLNGFTKEEIAGGLDLLNFGMIRNIPGEKSIKRVKQQGLSKLGELVLDKKFRISEILELREISDEFTKKFGV